MLRFIGFLFLILIVVGYSLHMDGPTWVAFAFYLGCTCIALAIVVAVIRRRW